MIYLIGALSLAVIGLTFAAWREHQLRLAQTERREAEHKDLDQTLRHSQQSFARIRVWMDELVAGSASFTEQDWPEKAVQATRSLLQAEKAVYVRIHPSLSEIEGITGRGISYEHLSLLKVHTGEGWFAWIAQSKELRLLASATELGPLIPQEQFLVAPCLFIPLEMNGEVHAVVAAWAPSGGKFHDGDMVNASFLSRWGSVVLNQFQMADRYRHLDSSLQTMLTNVLDARDGITCRHSERTARLTRFAAEEAGWPSQTVEQAALGAIFHDIGKCGIPDSVLMKPGPLDPAEFEVIKKHADIGFRILHPIPMWGPIASIVRHHQEWFNGQGYPEGLAQEEIPLAARLVAIADAWDAMTSNRPYRAAMPKSAAMAELRRQSGTQFDPKLTDLFLRVLDKLEREGQPTVEADWNASVVVPTIA